MKEPGFILSDDTAAPAMITRAKILRRLALAGIMLAVLALAGCGGGSASTSRKSNTGRPPPKRQKTAAAAPRPAPPPYPRLRVAALSSASSRFVPVVRWRGRTAVSIARLASGVTLLSFDQRLVTLRLHSGTVDAGASGWRYGPAITGAERSRVVAAFNGGFRLSTGSGGFEAYGRVAVPLRAGLGSVVTYAQGTTDVGSWHSEVPAAGKRVASVRQNLTLLIDHGQPAASIGCLECWGATLGGVVDPARAALGVSANGDLIWAGGEHLTVAALADALLHAHVVRAVELDINPEWVAGYLYAHHSVHGPPVPLAVVQGQAGIPGAFLAPWSRDFFSVDAR
jgi:hypothetical protein